MVDEPQSGNLPNDPKQPGSLPGEDAAAKASSAFETPPPPAQKPIDKPPRWFVPALVVALAVFLVIVYVNNWNLWDGIRSVEVTDDAYVRGEVTPLSTKVAGVVTQVPVTDFQHVKAGDVVARLRNDDFQARVDEAQASVKETQTAIEQLKKEEDVQDARISAAQSMASVNKTNISQSGNNTQSSRALREAAQAAIKQTRADLVAIEANILSDKAKAVRADLEQHRQHDLYADRAATRREVEQIDADSTAANEAIAADQARKAALLEALNSRVADLQKAKDQVANSIDGQRNAADEYSKAQANVLEQLRQKQVLIARESVLAAELKRKTATLKNAQVEYDYTYIRAPMDGTISERKVFPGQLVSAGTQAATLVSAIPWVIASYRETQLSHVFVGNKAEVTVDGLPGKIFKGVVDSISPASEAQFALLPPDNASGNFTKIAQRVPVKIKFDVNQPELERMRPGMSVIAHVWTKLHP